MSVLYCQLFCKLRRLHLEYVHEVSKVLNFIPDDFMEGLSIDIQNGQFKHRQRISARILRRTDRNDRRRRFWIFCWIRSNATGHKGSQFLGQIKLSNIQYGLAINENLKRELFVGPWRPIHDIINTCPNLKQLELREGDCLEHGRTSPIHRCLKSSSSSKTSHNSSQFSLNALVDFFLTDIKKTCKTIYKFHR